jgi:hypothetical protein
MDRYTRYYVNQSGGGEIGPAYRASYRMWMANGIGSFFRGLFRFVKRLLLDSGAKAVGKEALKTGSNIITYILNKESEQPVCSIFKKRFSQAKGNLEEKLKKMTWFCFALKRKRKLKKPVSRQT